MISNILGNKSVFKILILYSYGEGVGYNWTDLKQHTKLHIESLKKALEILYLYKILKKENRVIKLNLENEETINIMELIKSEKNRLNLPSFELYLALNSLLEEIQKNPKSEEIKEVYLFGSHAKKKASINSDIDIAIISNNVNLNFTKEIVKLEESINKEFQIIVLEKLSNDTLSIEIKKNGIKII